MKNPKKKVFFCKACLTLFVSGREKNAHFRAHYLFWPKLFWPKQCKPRSTIKIGVSAEIAQNQKWHLFFGKGVFFDMVEKLGFANCVFEKLCFFLVFLFFFLFCFFLFVFLGGLKGQVRWPKGPPHMALNPPFFVVCLFLFFFLFVFFLFLFFFGRA